MVQYNSLVDRIATDLREQIVQHKLKPGERLPSERSLCAAFGVGRTTIREALKSLVVRGLVILTPRGSSFGRPQRRHRGSAPKAIAPRASIYVGQFVLEDRWRFCRQDCYIEPLVRPKSP